MSVEMLYDSLFEDPIEETTEVTVQFDFPLHGNTQKYKVVSCKDGVITLYNPHCARPLGHE